MKKIISTKAHGFLDYGTAAALVAVPRLLRMDPFITKMLTGSAIVTTIYSLLTKYELGVFKVLPMKAHLGLDAAQSAAMVAAPLAFARASKSMLPVLMGISLFETAVALSTQTRPKRRFLFWKFK